MGLPQRRCRAGVPRGSARSWPLVAGAPRPRRAPARPRPPPRRPPRIPVTTKENIFGWKLREGRHGNTAAGFRQKPIVPAQKGAPGPCSLRRCKTGRGWGRSRAGPRSRGTQVPPCRGAPSLSLVWLGTWGAAGTPSGRWEQLGAELSVPIQAGRAVWDRAEDEDELVLRLGNPKSDPKSLSPKRESGPSIHATWSCVSKPILPGRMGGDGHKGTSGLGHSPGEPHKFTSCPWGLAGGSSPELVEQPVPDAVPPWAALPGHGAAASAGRSAGGAVSIKSSSISRAGWCLL